MSRASTNPASMVARWWRYPLRTGSHRMIAPYEYRHLRPFGITRVVGGCIALGVGVICLSYYAYGWAAFFLALGALNLGGGLWYLSIVRSRTDGPMAAQH